MTWSEPANDGFSKVKQVSGLVDLKSDQNIKWNYEMKLLAYRS